MKSYDAGRESLIRLREHQSFILFFRWRKIRWFRKLCQNVNAKANEEESKDGDDVHVRPAESPPDKQRSHRKVKNGDGDAGLS